jgi:hypothetical protein
MGVAEMLAHHTNQFKEKMARQTAEMETQIQTLKKEMSVLKKNLDSPKNNVWTRITQQQQSHYSEKHRLCGISSQFLKSFWPSDLC